MTSLTGDVTSGDEDTAKERAEALLDTLEGGVQRDNFEERYDKLESVNNLLSLQQDNSGREAERLIEQHNNLEEDDQSKSGFVDEERYNVLKRALEKYQELIQWAFLALRLNKTYNEEVVEVALKLRQLSNKEAILSETNNLIQNYGDRHKEFMEQLIESFSENMERFINRVEQRNEDMLERVQANNAEVIKALNKRTTVEKADRGKDAVHEQRGSLNPTGTPPRTPSMSSETGEESPEDDADKDGDGGDEEGNVSEEPVVEDDDDDNSDDADNDGDGGEEKSDIKKKFEKKKQEMFGD